MTPDWLISLAAFQQGVTQSADHAFVGLRHGSMRALLYAPRGLDDQTPHSQDELYIVQSGSGQFRKVGEVRAFGPGDVIFVGAGAEHRFEDFSDDFQVWAVFWGPAGGEQDRA